MSSPIAIYLFTMFKKFKNKSKFLSKVGSSAIDEYMPKILAGQYFIAY
jgi:hypothetical protein